METERALTRVDDVKALALNEWIQLSDDVSGRIFLESIESDVLATDGEPLGSESQEDSDVL